jgi:hypothetical protein
MTKHPNSVKWQAPLLDARYLPQAPYLFFNLPLGSTEVVGATGRLEVPLVSGGKLASFLGFLTILLLFWSPLAMLHSC